MDLQHWQAEFENWLKNHHQHQDAAHDVCHFRRVWATAQKLAADDDVDMLVILTACYFHDIVSLATQRYFYAGYLMHHSHLHSEFVHDLFSFH